MVRGKGSIGFIRKPAYTYIPRVSGLGAVPRDGETSFKGVQEGSVGRFLGELELRLLRAFR